MRTGRRGERVGEPLAGSDPLRQEATTGRSNIALTGDIAARIGPYVIVPFRHRALT